jgi:dTDP-4-amino-4,6-dideoxygalactose transaminase
MSSWAVPLADVVIDDADIEAVVATYRSGWLSMGPRIEEFEGAFATYTGARHAIAVSSGTAGLHVMCLAAALGPGDEVIVPALTFVATVNAVRYTGATPVFADIAGPLEPWLSTAACERAIGPRTRAILHVEYGGHPGEVARVAELADRHGLMLLHDAAHSIGAKVGDRHVGTLGKAAAYSFFANKNLAIGEGGMVTTDDDELARSLRLLRSHGMTTLTWDRHRGHASGYDVVALGFNYRMDEPRAALGTSRLARLDEEIARRADLDAAYRDALADLVECPLAAAEGSSRAHHLFTVLLPDGADRSAVRSALAARAVQTSVHYPPAHRFSAHAVDVQLPVTEDYAARTLTLPLFGHMTGTQQALVADALHDALGGEQRAGWAARAPQVSHG